MTYYNKIISSSLIIFAILSYFIGFSVDEVSMGAGGYNGDFKFVKNSIQIFDQNSIMEAILLFSESSNRTPLIYILHKTLNPYFTDEKSFRNVVLIISSSIPLLFFFCLKEKFKHADNLTLILLSSILFFNPFFRTSSFWGLEENYAIICALISIFFLLKISNLESTKNFKLYFYLLLLTLFSSLCIYFDQKFLIIPLICFIKIIFGKYLLRFKIFTTFSYSIFSIPFLFLIKLWGGIFPSNIYNLGNEFYIHHLGFALTIIAFIFFPFLLLKEKNLKNQLKILFSNKRIIISLFIIIFYLIFVFFFHSNDYLSNRNDGGGIVKKLSFIFFNDLTLREFFVLFCFLISWVFIIFFLENNYINLLLTSYFLIIALVTRPFYQEYFDPIIFILVFFIYKFSFNLNLKKIYLIYFYFLIFLIGTNIYYN